jgi:hypothetical protein
MSTRCAFLVTTGAVLGAALIPFSPTLLAAAAGLTSRKPMEDVRSRLMLLDPGEHHLAVVVHRGERLVVRASGPGVVILYGPAPAFTVEEGAVLDIDGSGGGYDHLPWSLLGGR